jgi:hypothetical protein
MYTVYYKKWFWRKLKDVEGDGILEHGKSRWFMLKDKTRVEIPINYEFKFSKERFYDIKDKMEKESGHKL